jgi:hypothetical protein
MFVLLPFTALPFHPPPSPPPTHTHHTTPRLTDSNEVTSNQLLRGFQRVAANLPDTALDNPAAPVSVACFFGRYSGATPSCIWWLAVCCHSSCSMCSMHRVHWGCAEGYLLDGSTGPRQDMKCAHVAANPAGTALDYKAWTATHAHQEL